MDRFASRPCSFVSLVPSSLELHLSTPGVECSRTISLFGASDEQLMEGIRNRNETAFNHLYQRYAAVLRALVMKVLKNETESDDLLQEIFIKVWRDGGAYNPREGKPLGWLITLSHRRAIDRVRRREAYWRMEERLAEKLKRVPREYGVSVREEVAHAEMRDHIVRVFKELPPAYSEALELAFFRGMSQRQIAVFTNTPVGTVKSRVERAMRKVATALQDFQDLL